MKNMINYVGLALVSLALSGMVACTQAATDGLKAAKDALQDAKKITVTAPSKDTWFSKNLAEAAQGKVVSVRVDKAVEDEVVYVEKADGSALVICPIGDGQASVVTDKETVAQYKPKAPQPATPVAQSQTSAASGKTWTVRGKTVRAGMTPMEVTQTIGQPRVVESDGKVYVYDNSNQVFNVGKQKYWRLRFDGSNKLTNVEFTESGNISLF